MRCQRSDTTKVRKPCLAKQRNRARAGGHQIREVVTLLPLAHTASRELQVTVHPFTDRRQSLPVGPSERLLPPPTMRPARRKIPRPNAPACNSRAGSEAPGVCLEWPKARSTGAGSTEFESEELFDGLSAANQARVPALQEDFWAQWSRIVIAGHARPVSASIVNRDQIAHSRHG